MTEILASNELASRIYGLVLSYALAKTERRCGISWDKVKEGRTSDAATGKAQWNVPQSYRDAREAVCSSAFLRVRACKSREDFLAYFTGTLCSVPQHLPKEEIQELSRVLLDQDRWEDAKALTMLALSSLSRI